MSIPTSSINRTLYQRNNQMATISLYNSRSLLDAQYKTGNCEKRARVCVRAGVRARMLRDTSI